MQFDNTEAPKISLTVGHIGDTSVIACDSEGRAIPLTSEHHGSVTTERARIEARGGEMIESDGKLRVMGKLEPTRSIGDLAFKAVGVYAEPEISTLTRPANDLAFIILATDGVTQSMTPQEIVDCVKGSKTPQIAADNLVNLAESLNIDDNKTCLILRLNSWNRASSGQIPDLTKELRDRRLAKYSRGGAGAKPGERAEDEDISLFLARSGSQETLRDCAKEVFAYFKSSKIAAPENTASKALNAGQIRAGLNLGGIGLDDWQFDGEEERTHEWRKDRSNAALREQETSRIVGKVFQVLDIQPGGAITEKQFVHGMTLLGVFVTDVAELEGLAPT